MAEPVTRVSRRAAPATIEADLAGLWGEVGRDGPVARAVMSNLVVYRAAEPPGGADLETSFGVLSIQEVAERHPARIILLEHGGSPAPAASVDAAISILLFGAGQSRYGVEAIALRSACAEHSLPSIVRRLALGDVPTSIWWTEDLSRMAPPAPLVPLGRQIVFDSRRWTDVLNGVLALLPFLARTRPVDLADVNWRRLTPVRQAIVHAARSAATRLDAGTPIVIRHAPGEAALGWLLAGWICSRLGRAGEAAWRISVEEAPQGETRLAVHVGPSVMLTLDSQRALVSDPQLGGPVAFAVPAEPEADAVVAELRSLAQDPCLIDALLALPRLLAPGRE